MDEVDLPSLISLAAGAIERHVREHLLARGFDGLRTRHGYVFQRLMTGPQSISDLGRSLNVTQQAMSKTVRELTDLGYVETISDTSDARRKLVQLTARGHDSITAARDVRSRLNARVAGRVSTPEFAGATVVLAALLNDLGIGGHVKDRSVPDPEGQPDNRHHRGGSATAS